MATLALGAVAKASVGLPRGVSPANAKSYVPESNGQWRCLDGSKTIPFTAVNDDYCDCKDGSDEPGTSACGTGQFYCANIGHEGASIKSSRVNDGVCDPECCDGSDEYNGQIYCPNVCEIVGAEAKKERERVRVIQEKGAKLRKEFIEYGKTAKAGLEIEINELKAKINELQTTAASAKETMDKANEKLENHLEGTKNEREAMRKVQLKPVIDEQARRLKRSQDSKASLYKTLHNLKENHNKNYHDLAVKQAAAAFDEFVESQSNESAPSESSTESDTDSSADDELKQLTDDTFIVQRDIVTLYDILAGMKEDYNKEYNDEAVISAVKVTEEFEVHWDSDRQEFKDDSLLDIPAEESNDNPVTEKLREGKFKDDQSVDELDLAQAAHDTASDEESSTKDRISDIERKMQVDFGPDETFAKLLDQCFEFKDAEYTYSICLFGDANQKSHSTMHLGKFSGWGEGNKKYETQWYTGGIGCWNGPDRSAKLELTCGESTEITSVTEPEKCVYLFKMQTPAVCPLFDQENVSSGTAVKHDEL
ncbi:hypothetical protein BGZ76_003923 [Entomortierella beljakovae]|nr:hypothetical protein BGZ76_003923 [Entomortierella beljakovae]